jgi:hypothetical protein
MQYFRAGSIMTSHTICLDSSLAAAVFLRRLGSLTPLKTTYKLGASLMLDAFVQITDILYSFSTSRPGNGLSGRSVLVAKDVDCASMQKSVRREIQGPALYCKIWSTLVLFNGVIT